MRGGPWTVGEREFDEFCERVLFVNSPSQKDEDQDEDQNEIENENENECVKNDKNKKFQTPTTHIPPSALFRECHVFSS